MKNFWKTIKQINSPAKILPGFMVLLTQAPRFLPEFNWCDHNWTYNLFRVYELIFWRKYTVRPEAAAYGIVNRQGKLQKIKYYFFTKEAFFAHIEGMFRIWLKEKTAFKLEFIKVSPVQLATPNGGLEIRIPWISFAIAFDNDANGGAVSGTSTSYAYTVTGSNPIWLGGMVGSTTGDRYSANSYNSVNATKINAIQPDSDRWTSLSLLMAPATGSNTAAFSITSGSDNFVIPSCASYSGCSQTGQPDATQTFHVDNGTSVADTLASSADNCWHVAFMNEDSGIPTVGSGTTKRGTENINAFFADGNAAVHPAGNSTLNFNTAGGANHYIAGISVTIKPPSTVNTGAFMNFF